MTFATSFAEASEGKKPFELLSERLQRLVCEAG